MSYVATIGFFDGVHLGHQHLIKEVKKNAEENHRKSLIITFAEHPLKTIKSDFKPQLLSTFSERMGMLEDCGVDFCYPLDFTKEISKMTAEQVYNNVLTWANEYDLDFANYLKNNTGALTF